MTSNKADQSRGVFVSFEGGEGAGKTTHIRFLAETLEARGFEVVRLREPGGTAIGDKLRSIVLDPGNAAMCDACELLVYEAARAQIVEEVIKPALNRGAVVLCDRFFDSTTAYQAYGRGLDADFVRRANQFACQGIVPDRTILLVPPSTKDGLIRATKNDGADRLESAGVEFHERVRNAFAEIAADDPKRIRTRVSGGTHRCDRAAGQRERSVEGIQPATRLPNGKNSPADGEKQSKSYYQYGSCQPGICCRTDV